MIIYTNKIVIMKKLFFTVVLIASFGAVFTSCKEGNDRDKKESGIENTYEEGEMDKTITEEKQKYSNGTEALRDSLHKAENDLKKAKEKGNKAAEAGDRVTAQKTEEERKKIQKRINEIKNQINEKKD